MTSTGVPSTKDMLTRLSPEDVRIAEKCGITLRQAYEAITGDAQRFEDNDVISHAGNLAQRIAQEERDYFPSPLRGYRLGDDW